MKLFISPHNDDETLFGSWTLIREQPAVLVVYDSIAQGRLGISINQRRQETFTALYCLGVPTHMISFGGVRDDYNESADVVAALELWEAINGEPSIVWAPAAEEGGHLQHNLVGIAAENLWPGKVMHYLTYKRGAGKSRNKNEVAYKPDWIYKKLRALACYKTQIVNEAAQCFPWFAEDLKEYYQ